MPAHYRIRVSGYLDREWSSWFDSFTISHDADGCTTLAGLVVDQAALYGLIAKARDLGLTLVLVARSEPDAQARCTANGAEASPSRIPHKHTHPKSSRSKLEVSSGAHSDDHSDP